MKKILFFIDVFGCGGIERFLYNTCKYIDKMKFEVSVLSVVLDENSYYIKMFDDIGISIDKLIDKKETNVLKRAVNGHKAFKEYLNSISKDVIIHFNISNSIDMKYAEIAYELGFSNLIYHSHNSDATSNLKRVAHYLFKSCRCKYSALNIACSKKAAIWMYRKKDIYKKNYVIINNAIDAGLYDYNEEKRKKIRKELSVGDDLLIGNVGRYNIQKNHDFLVDVFYYIHEKRKDSKLLLIGEGELFQHIELKIKKLGLDKNVIFIKQTNKVEEYLQAMDVFVLPSFYEGLPFVLVEEQAAGLPSVVSDTITQEVKITDCLNYLSLDLGPKEWASRVLLLLNNKRYSTLSTIIKSGFDVHDSIQKLEKIYESFS